MTKPCFTREELEQLAGMLKALAHPNRLMIVSFLSKNGESSVSDICEALGCTQPLVSHHVIDMNQKGILTLRREGRNAFYSIADEKVIKAIQCLMECRR